MFRFRYKVRWLLVQELGEALVLCHGSHDVPHFPVLFFESTAQQGDKYFHEHQAVIDGKVHFFGFNLHGDFATTLEHVGQEAEFVVVLAGLVCEFGKNGACDYQTVDDGVAVNHLGILLVGLPQETGVKVGVVCNQDGALTAESGELAESVVNAGRVFDHVVGDVVDPGCLGGNEHAGFYERLKFRNELGDDAVVLCFDGELDGTNFDDFVFLVVETCCLQVKCYEFGRNCNNFQILFFLVKQALVGLATKIINFNVNRCQWQGNYEIIPTF